MKRTITVIFLFLFALLFIGASEPIEKENKNAIKCPYLIKIHDKSEKSSCPYSGQSKGSIDNDNSKKDFKCPYSDKSNKNKTQKSSKRLISI